MTELVTIVEQLKSEDRALLAGFFNEHYYARHNPDVVERGADPLAHYLTFGWIEGRNPSECFNGQYYLSRYPDVAAANMCPLVHYLRYGIAEGRFSSPQHEFASSVKSEDEHMVNALKKVLRISYPQFEGMNDDFINKYILFLFSPDYYKKTRNLSNDLNHIQLLMHYIVYGLPEGVSPGPLFDEGFYKRQLDEMHIAYPADVPLFQHWLLLGTKRQMSPTPLFAERAYLARNPDLAGYDLWLFDHFLRFGMEEGRQFLASMQIGSNNFSSNPRLAPPPALEFLNTFDTDDRRSAGDAAIKRMDEFSKSDLVSDIFIKANAIEPDIGPMARYTTLIAPPWHDSSYITFKTLRAVIPEGEFDDIVFMPFCKLGGADFVAGVLVKSLIARRRRVLILRTEQSDWARPDWFPQEVANVDLSIYLSRMDEHDVLRALYVIVMNSKARSIYNVNSYRCFKLLEKFGKQLKTFVKSHVYYFCADRDENGFEVGYPVWFFANILNDISTAIFDTDSLRSALCTRYGLIGPLAEKTRTIYTPSMAEPKEAAMAVRQVETRSFRGKPVMLWAGRLDRQKRFDLVIEIARKMPNIEFQCWGKAVLDLPPDTASLPENLHLNGTFKSLEELPLDASDGWLYTSEWDGLPTILIECAALGVPIVASAVGGVPELITAETGWLVEKVDDVDSYVAAITDMLSNGQIRIERASRARELVKKRHNMSAYVAEIALIGGE